MRKTGLTTAATTYTNCETALFASSLETVAGETNSGFWLHVRGVRVWVPCLAEADRAFFDADKPRIERLFAARRQVAARDLTAQATRLAQEEALIETWAQLPDWPAALAAWSRRETLWQVVAGDLLPATEAFEEQLTLYETDAPGRVAHERATQQAAEAVASLKVAQDALAVTKFRHQEVIRKLDALPAVDAAAIAQTEAATQQAAQELGDWLHENQLAADALPYSETELAALVRDSYKLGAAVADQEKELANLHTQLAQAEKTAENCDAEYERCHNDYQELTDQPAPDAPPAVPPPAELPDTAAVEVAQRAYEQEFDQLSAGMSVSLARRPVYDDGPALLMRELLPEVLHGVVESEEALRLVGEQLQRINENNRLIAKLKLELLQTVFDQVRTCYYNYVEEAKRIRAYFLGRKVQITGGFKPELKVGPAPDYPLEWMSVFGQLLREQASQPAQFARLSEAESLEELMCQAYKHYGGPLSQPRAADLLNPRAYLSLEFGMGSARVKANKGSNGQTFMAVALLNIARLSVIGGGEQRPGIRFMPVDEAAGLGSNYAVLLELARDKSYQVISLSPEPILDEASEQHRVYFLAFDPMATALNLHPMMLNMQQKLVPVPAPLAFAQTLFDHESDQPAATA